MVLGLDYQDPRIDEQHALQSFKKHPFISKLLEGGKMVRYGAKSLPYGGWFSVPPLAGDGWMIVGDSASFLNSQRLKGIHLAIKSGMLAAEAAYHALVTQRFDAAQLDEYPRSVENSWIKKELWPVRNFHQGFEKGFLHGLFNAAVQQVTGGRGFHQKYPSHPGYKQMEHINRLPEDGGSRAAIIGPARREHALTFDKVTDVYYSGTKHEEDQPSHLVIHDTNICNQRCIQEYGNPCQNFCPANVYEMVESPNAPGAKQIHLNPSNCVHCKTCDIMDPYQIITWVPPEGGGGPNYDGM